MHAAPPQKASAIAQRAKPAGAALVGGLVLGLNVLALAKGAFFFPFGTVLGCVLLLAGIFGVLVGEPDDPYGNRPLWFKVGVVVSIGLGVVLGLVVNIALVS
jgi:hypothetical protein